ncbi:MAG: hypothetical protein AB7I41_09595 [Candidatus Sericytochromatia bacterium]
MGYFPMGTAGKGLFLRSCTTWLVLVLFLLSCTAQPPSLKTTSTTNPIVAAIPKSNVSWIPQDVYYQKNALPRSDNFKIQDYPQDCGGDICSVTSLSASMNWPSIGGNTSASISLDNANNYVYGFKVLEWGKKDNGERIATLVQMGMSAYAGHEKPEPPYLRRDIGSLYMYFTSTNGVNYVPTHSYAGNIVGNFSIFSADHISGVDPTICQLVQGSGTGPIKINPSLTLDPQGQKATVSFSLSASNVLNSGLNWRIVDQNEDPPVYGCLNTGAIGSASASMSMTVRIPFIKEVVDTITVSADPATIDPRSNAQSKIKVTPSNPSRNWTLKAKAKKIDESCTFSEKNLASGSGTKIDIPFGGGVPDGEYELIAEYDDANRPKEPGTVTVTANSPFEMKADPTQIGIGGSSTISVSKAPVCPGWTITQTGGKQVKTFPTSPDVNCSNSLFASGTGPQSIPWNGTCSGIDFASGNVVSGPVDTGSVTFQGQAGDKTASVSVNIQNGTPTPCPPGENCPTPPGPSCPPGQVCPPGPTPTPPGPTPTPPEVTDPPEGPPPPPPACPGPLCPPPPGPPAPPRTPDPRPTQKPPTPPTPTPTPGGAFCPAGTDAEQVQDSGFKLMAQTPETFEDTRELNQSLKDWNQLQNQLNPGFSIAANKPKKDANLEAQLAAVNQRFQTLYWNVRDELSYLEPMRRQLAEVLYKQAGSLPSVTLSSNLVAQAQGYEQQFKAQQGDLDGLEELKILYSELQTYLWVTRLFIEQNNDSAEVVEALRKLKGQIVEHSEYLAREYKLFETGDPAEIAAENQEIDSLIAELETAIAELGGDFQIQALSINEIKAKATQLANQLKALKTSKNISQRIAVLQNSRNFILKELMSRSSRMTADFVGGGKTKLLNALIKILRAGLKIESFRRTLQEISCDEAVSIKQKFDEFNRLMVLIEKAAQAIAEKITSNECIENGDPKVLQAAIEKLLLLGNEQTGSLKVINDKANQTFRLLDKDSDVGPGSAFQKSLDELILLAAHLSQNLGQQLDSLIDACEDNCGDEIKALTDYYNAMPENLPVIGISQNIYDYVPTRQESYKNMIFKVYENMRAARDAYYQVYLPAELKFMGHALGGHGGTVPNDMLLMAKSKSKFISDKTLFKYTLEAYQKRATSKASQARIETGTVIGKTSVGTLLKYPDFKKGDPLLPSGLSLANATKYLYDFNNSKCKIYTIYPEP